VTVWEEEEEEQEEEEEEMWGLPALWHAALDSICFEGFFLFLLSFSCDTRARLVGGGGVEEAFDEEKFPHLADDDVDEPPGECDPLAALP